MNNCQKSKYSITLMIYNLSIDIISKIPIHDAMNRFPSLFQVAGYHEDTLIIDIMISFTLCPMILFL